MRSRPLHAILSATLLVVGLAGCADAPAAEEKPVADGGHFPVEVTSCGFTSTLNAPPERAVTLNQGATEVVLALDLADRLVGTAYLDDEVPQKWRTAYESVPVLSEQYPSREALLKAAPDFAYASYGSAFDRKAVGSREELADSGIASYTSPFGCGEEGERPETTFESVWREVDAVADAFGVPERATALREAQQRQLEELAASAAGEGVDVFWYDSGEKSAFTGAGGGGPQLVLDAVGATNLFAHVEGGWADVSWEKVVESDPDVIVLADAAWSTAADKIAYLEGDPVLGQLRAVREQRYVTIPFSESTPGVRLVDGAVSVAEQLEALDQ